MNTTIIMNIVKILIAIILIRHGLNYVVRSSKGYRQMIRMLTEIEEEMRKVIRESLEYISCFCYEVSLEEAFEAEDKEIVATIDKINKSSLITTLMFFHPSFYIITRIMHIGKSNIQILNKLFVTKINRIHYLIEKQKAKHVLLIG